jgi:hypothetical protein
VFTPLTGWYWKLRPNTEGKPHFKQLFMLKGNYNEGFGTAQHKMKWLGGSAPEGEVTVDAVC